MSSRKTLVVVNHERDFSCDIAGATIVSAHDYLNKEVYAGNPPAQVINLCRYDHYQSRGYYVSLLAEARGQRPLPEMKFVGDLQGGNLGELARDAFTNNLQRLLEHHCADECTLDVFFGRDRRGTHDALARRVFLAMPAPLLRVGFTRSNGRWQTAHASVLSVADLSPNERAFVTDAMNEYLHHVRPRSREASSSLAPALAILYNADEPDPPSNQAALASFCRAAAELGARYELVARTDLRRLPEFDGLFIRDTTRVNHYTYEFARAAADEGLVVIDDPDSIMKCTNKVFLNELLGRHHVPMPKTMTVHRNNAQGVAAQLGLPCVLKQPDGAFSLGVFKVETRSALADALANLLTYSDLVLAQQWLPTAFDWRVGVLDRRAIYVCKYFMAPGHWQVVKREAQRKLEGSTLTMTVGEAPASVVKTALRAANLIGDGLYGVDIKEDGGQCYVMEVNDNPNIDAGNEDAILKDALYRDIVGVFLRRIRERKGVPVP
jgi:glutathione synthase/RimK-type ligase-like ATP-grasp enzyme